MTPELIGETLLWLSLLGLAVVLWAAWTRDDG